jgi:magnesium transporter
MNGLDLNNISSLPIGFVIVMVTMAVISGILLVFFRRKKWILVKSADPRADMKDTGELKES